MAKWPSVEATWGWHVMLFTLTLIMVKKNHCFPIILSLFFFASVLGKL